MRTDGKKTSKCGEKICYYPLVLKMHIDDTTHVFHSGECSMTADRLFQPKRDFHAVVKRYNGRRVTNLQELGGGQDFARFPSPFPFPMLRVSGAD
jgi:hypothetical protein